MRQTLMQGLGIISGRDGRCARIAPDRVVVKIAANDPEMAPVLEDREPSYYSAAWRCGLPTVWITSKPTNSGRPSDFGLSSQASAYAARS